MLCVQVHDEKSVVSLRCTSLIPAGLPQPLKPCVIVPVSVRLNEHCVTVSSDLEPDGLSYFHQTA